MKPPGDGRPWDAAGCFRSSGGADNARLQKKPDPQYAVSLSGEAPKK